MGPSQESAIYHNSERISNCFDIIYVYHSDLALDLDEFWLSDYEFDGHGNRSNQFSHQKLYILPTKIGLHMIQM